MEPKISCRHVWKIFGPNPEKFFRAHGGDPTSEAFAGSGYIPAVRDATLDVFPGEILVIQNLLQKTIVFITHDFDEAIRLADRIAIMNEGVIVQIGGAAELITHPANDYVAEFTREVPRDRLLTVEDVMASDIDPGAGAAPVQASAPIHAAARRILQSDTPLRVVDENDATRGSISRADVIDALFEDRSVRS